MNERRSEVERVALPSTINLASAGRLTTMVAGVAIEASSLPFSFGIAFTFSAGAAAAQPEQADLWQVLQPWQRSRLNRPPWLQELLQPWQRLLQPWLRWQELLQPCDTAWQLLMQPWQRSRLSKPPWQLLQP